MKIKRTSENKYIALDDEDRRIGVCTVARRELPRIFPDCPVRYEINVRASDECRDLLYGAAVTRARVCAARENGPCLVYAAVDAADREGLEVLRALGFTVKDGVQRMYRDVTDERVTLSVPRDCTIVRDFLENEDELNRCLRRYNECFDEQYDRAWLKQLTENDNFARILMVSPTELCGEALVWSRGRTGVIGVIQTSRAWRRRGVASYLMEDARKYFASLGLKDISFDVWLSSPGCLPLAKKSGYRKGETLVYYPEVALETNL